jgi:hypothetical protein
MVLHASLPDFFYVEILTTFGIRCEYYSLMKKPAGCAERSEAHRVPFRVSLAVDI